MGGDPARPAQSGEAGSATPPYNRKLNNHGLRACPAAGFSCLLDPACAPPRSSVPKPALAPQPSSGPPKALGSTPHESRPPLPAVLPCRRSARRRGEGGSGGPPHRGTGGRVADAVDRVLLRRDRPVSPPPAPRARPSSGWPSPSSTGRRSRRRRSPRRSASSRSSRATTRSGTRRAISSDGFGRCTR